MHKINVLEVGKIVEVEGLRRSHGTIRSRGNRGHSWNYVKVLVGKSKQLFLLLVFMRVYEKLKRLLYKIKNSASEFRNIV